jgi:hypothetical protein
MRDTPSPRLIDDSIQHETRFRHSEHVASTFWIEIGMLLQVLGFAEQILARREELRPHSKLGFDYIGISSPTFK